MSVLDNINIKIIKQIANDILDNIDYLEDFGYAISYKEDDEKVKNYFQDFVNYSKKACEALNKIAEIAEDNFGN